MTQLPFKLSQAEQDVLDERRGQRNREGFFASHDDGHVSFELSMAAAEYLHSGVILGRHPAADVAAIREPGSSWPFERKFWKPTSCRRDLVKAAALILAEIERLDRAEARKGGAA